jgi:hypothetical protein
MALSAIASAARRRISRIQAFTEQGVRLTYPARSWSGVRELDGAIVIAVREGDVQASADGFRCLLWSPVIEGATQWVDRPIKQERLGHCRRAVACGGADGLMTAGEAADVERDFVLPLRVEKLGAEYWAFWGSLASGDTGTAAILRGPAHAMFEPARMAA